ncbi:MAG: NAD(P)-dependent oxidoreductase [Friedmanniella sp.]|nr:NAD(P)-dependent oxidoreductase [Friedmanniella sp.]
MEVAVLGTGAMGFGMAQSLLRAGHAVRVWNRTSDRAAPLAEEGATVAGTASEAVRGADVVVTMLFDLASTEAVVTGSAAAFGPETVWVQTATVGRSGAAWLADLAADHGIATLDSPVLGTKKPAADGTLVVLASGDPAVRERVQPVYDAISSRVVWAGDQLGAASALKLACNAWVLSITTATAQSLALTRSFGLDPALFLAAIDDGPTNSPYAQLKGKAMIAGDYPASFELSGALKDLGLIIRAADEAEVRTGVLDAVRDAFATAEERGHGHDDIAAVHEAMGDRP